MSDAASLPLAPRPWVKPAIGLALIGLLAIIYALGGFAWLSWSSIKSNLDYWQRLSQEHALLAATLFTLLFIAITALSLPVAGILTLLAGALFGRWWGTGIVCLASTIGATLAFWSARYLFRDWLQRQLGPRAQGINAGIENNGPLYLLSLRLVPVVPFFLVNLAAGLTRIRTLPYATVSALGMLPGTFVYVNAGTALGNVDEPKDLVSTETLLALVLLGVVPLALKLLYRWCRLLR